MGYFYSEDVAYRERTQWSERETYGGNFVSALVVFALVRRIPHREQARLTPGQAKATTQPTAAATTIL